MIVIVGLGNPGKKYEGTRHNIGFAVVNALREELHGDAWRFDTDMEAELSETVVGDTKVMLAKPQTYMNNSGQAVGRIAHYYKVDPAEIFVAYDDADLPVGTLRIRLDGSSGGHNGLQSVIDVLGTDQFPHFRIGINSSLRDEHSIDTKDFVLGKFTTEEQTHVDETTAKTVQALLDAVKTTVDHAMNTWNQRA